MAGLLCPQPHHVALFLFQPSLCPWLGRAVARGYGSQAFLGCWGPSAHTVFPPIRPFPFMATWGRRGNTPKGLSPRATSDFTSNTDWLPATSWVGACLERALGWSLPAAPAICGPGEGSLAAWRPGSWLQGGLGQGGLGLACFPSLSRGGIQPSGPHVGMWEGDCLCQGDNLPGALPWGHLQSRGGSILCRSGLVLPGAPSQAPMGSSTASAALSSAALGSLCLAQAQLCVLLPRSLSGAPTPLPPAPRGASCPASYVSEAARD